MAGKKARKAKAKASGGFTADEKAAMRERVKELKAAARGAGKEENEKAQLEKIAAMSPKDRAMATRIHAVVKAHAPILESKLWYGMPAYAKDDKIVCFFQPAEKFKARYSTFGFSDQANLDDGPIWATGFALQEITSATEAKIAALLKKAVR